MRPSFLFFILFLICVACDKPASLQGQKPKSDTIIFSGIPKDNFFEVFGRTSLTTLDSTDISHFVEDSIYYVKVHTKQDFKFILKPLTPNLTIRPNKDKFNEFILQTKKLSPDSSRETASIFFKFDKSYNDPIIIRRDIPSDTLFKQIDYYLNWDGLMNWDFKIKKR